MKQGLSHAGAPFRLSVLDQSPVSEGWEGGQALRNSIDLAQSAEKLGYPRYWVAEHHGTPGLACTSPEVLMAAIGSATGNIRIGSGGVMLPHYSPLKVAEQFSMLSALYPGRVDLGIGRAAGTDPQTAFALQRDRRQRSEDDFREQLEELLAYVWDRMNPAHPFARLAGLLPGRPEAPEAWLLGSSPQSAIWAAELGLPYAFADFINGDGAQITGDYRRQFVPSERNPKPRVIVATWALCADTDAEAQRLAASSRMMFTLLRRGELIAVPPVEKAAAFLEREAASRLPQASRRLILGTPETVRAGLERVAGEYGAEEAMVVTITHDHEARRRSYELIAEAFAGDRVTGPAVSATV